MHPTNSHTHKKETKNEIFKNTLRACGFIVLSRVLGSVLENSFSPDPDMMMMMMLRRGRRRNIVPPPSGHATGKKTEDTNAESLVLPATLPVTAQILEIREILS